MKVLIFGKFDILHPGHIFLIREAQNLGEVTAVLESDKNILKHHNFTPFFDEQIRKSNLLKYKLKVSIRRNESFEDIIVKHKPEVLVLGYDQHFLKESFSPLSKKYNFKIKITTAKGDHLFKSSRLRSVLEDKQAAIYLIDKPKGLTSFKAVAALRKRLDMRKVGFAGTLDPLASGLMLLATGKATRLLDWFHFLPKTYEADIIFGQTSASYDLETEQIINKKAKEFSQEKLLVALKKISGKSLQTAPMFSAKKIDGKKLYNLARQGKKVSPPQKEIEIFDIKLNKFTYPKVSISVTVSAGTYIRSLAYDLGELLGTGAVLAGLRRTDIGDFDVTQALNLNKLSSIKLKQARVSSANIISSLNQWFYQSRFW